MRIYRGLRGDFMRIYRGLRGDFMRIYRGLRLLSFGIKPQSVSQLVKRELESSEVKIRKNWARTTCSVQSIHIAIAHC